MSATNGIWRSCAKACTAFANGAQSSGGVGVFSTGYKFSVPLKFIPHSYGSWTIYTGFQYYYYIVSLKPLQNVIEGGHSGACRESPSFQL